MAEMIVKHPIIFSYSESATVNIGNYESRKVHVGLSVPLPGKKEENRRMVEEIKKKVKEELEKIIEEIRKEAQEKVEFLEEEDL